MTKENPWLKILPLSIFLSEIGVKMMRTILKNSLLGAIWLILSCTFAGLSLLIPSTFQNHMELEHVNLGYPLHFLVQDQSSLPIGNADGPQFPIYHGLLSPWEYSFQIIWWRFFLNLLILFLLVMLVWKIRIIIKHKVAQHRVLPI
jgi:hypothetical protein